MATIHLVTGGCRSGKSRRAQELAESFPGRRVFIATCPVLDEEMRHRIQMHQDDRAGRNWETLEEPLDVAGAVAKCQGSAAVLIDCVTLWISNLLFQAEQHGGKVGEQDVVVQVKRVLAACGQGSGNVIFVTNEVGLGIVPENALARQYRDLVGRANQTIAAAADHVTLMCCGLGIELKGKYRNNGTA
jgi:adenosylcobinamide kinase/adenosylcobinamide-phosphate guanylyltransferase